MEMIHTKPRRTNIKTQGIVTCKNGDDSSPYLHPRMSRFLGDDMVQAIVRCLFTLIAICKNKSRIPRAVSMERHEATFMQD
jgi:hypothetical protein